MLNPTYALAAALIWSVSPVYYGVFVRKFDFLTLNLLRTSTSAAVLVVPALYFGLGGGLSYAVVSGVVTLTVGDTLFLLSLREVGASVATPVVYVYVLFVQLTAGTVGETVPLVNFVSAGLIVAGVFLFSRGGKGRLRLKGMVLALLAGLAWTAGQDLVALALNVGAHVVAVTFTRDFSAAVALGLAVIVTGRRRLWPKAVPLRELAFMAFISATDLALGSLLLVYSISLVGVAITVIVTSLSPFLAQVVSELLGKESPGRGDYAGGALIVVALVISVLL